MEGTLTDQQPASPKSEKKSPFLKQKSAPRVDQLEIQSAHGSKPASPRPEKRSPFSLPKFGGSKSVEDDSSADKSSDKKKVHQRQKSEPLPRMVLLVENVPCDVEPTLKEIVTGILPISYEDEIVQKRTQIMRDPLQDLLLFPQDDVVASTVPRELRTVHPTVPYDALSQASNLFTRECIRFYTANWNCIENKDASYSGSYLKLPRPAMGEGLQEQLFEMDMSDEVDSQNTEAPVSPLRQKGISKQGYLTKAPFDGESENGSGVTKTYKRRWFHLKQTSSDGSYILEYKKDDSNTNMARGVIYLDACTHIAKGVKGRMYGFELHIQDKVYGLIADSQAEMDSWISAMCKVTGIDMELSGGKSSFLPSFGSKLKPPKIHQSLRESLKNSKHPELQEFAKETDALNSKRRKDSRHKLFSLVRDLDNNSQCVNIDDARIDAEVYTEHFGERIVVECEELKFRLVRTNSSGKEFNVEPFFTTLALFDVKRGIKLSEDFHCDLNHPSIRKMMVTGDMSENGHLNGDSHNGQVRELMYKYPRKAVFSVTHPSADVYLVVRIEKVLQGSISSCAEPYLKSGDAKKTALKAHKMAEIYCKKLGQYTMPFAWTARPLFTSDGKLDTTGEFALLYKQEREKLGDEELLKILSSFTSNREKSVKQQVIPGNLQLSVKKFSEGWMNCVTPSLVHVRPFDDSLNEAATIEVQELCQSPEAAYPHAAYVNNLYVYPTSLNYNNQKVFSKARNISVTVEFRDSDGYDPQPLKCIYDKSGAPGFTTQATAAVLHHCTNPTFYEEVKILLPTQLTDKHHLFFTFHHISCEQSKSSTGGSMKGKPLPIETPVGYAWMPILNQGSPRSHEGSLMVAQTAPLGYLAAAPAGLGKVTGPDVKWVDRERSLFRVNTRLVSTVYSQDSNVENFFAHCQTFDGSVASEVELTKLLKLMYVVEVSTVVKFLPVIMNQLFHVLLVTSHEDSALNVVRVFIRIASQIHEANKLEILKSYIKYVFVTEQARGSKKTVHEELAKYLMMCLKPGADPVVVNNLMKHSWFFFEVIVKSMAQTLIQTNRVKRINRDNWFPDSYHKSLEHFLQAFVPQIISRLKEQPQIAKDANLHSACFIKDCFTYMDRGFVFQMISYYSEQFKDSDTQMLEFKFEFLQVVCNHEHFIPLNLPLDVRALGGLNECELTDDYCRRYFLVGLLLREVSSALTQGRHIRKLAIRVLRNLLIKHELDERYDNDQKQARIATLYLPFLTVLLNHAPRFQGSKHDLSQISAGQLPQATSTVSTSDYGSDSNRSSCQSTNVKQSPNNSLTQTAASTLKEASQIAFQVPLDEDETKELLLCFLYVIKNLEAGVILDWWRQIMTGAVNRPHWHFNVWNYMSDHHMSKFAAVIDVFDLLELALKHFKYKGRTEIGAQCASTSENAKQFLQQKYQGAYSTKSSLQRHSRSSSSGVYSMDAQTRVLMEGNLANEVGLIVLDTIELFCNHFKFHLEQDDGDNVLMKQIVSVLLSFLQIPQSELLMKHVFASFRSFINKFPASLFKGSASHCGDMCREILCCCNSKLESLRSQACSFLYLLMRSNFEFSGGRGCDRVHWQVIVAVSRLMASGLNRAAVNNSLQSLKDYASLDKGMKNTTFPSEVKDLTKKIHTVLQATAQMKEHDDIPEVLVDLQYSLAKSYSGTPELRETWLEHMAAVHEAQENYSEAAMCYVHAAALAGEYLKRQDVYPEGCAAFRAVSPNIVPDESVMKTDEGMSMGQRYTERHFADLLEQCAKSLERAERYEVLGEIYKLAIPIYEKERNFKGLANAYDNLSKAYKKVVEVMNSGKRMMGVFFRVAFFGQVFADDDGKEYIYKEPKVTSLAEVSSRLEQIYRGKHGNDAVKLILESAKVQADTLDPKVGHIQITYVEPYFDEDELSERVTLFERNHNIRRFIYETPFTASGKAHGSLTEQCKRKTVLTTSNTFPYVKKRILVVQEEQFELTPVEVAIDEMENKVQELNKVISQSPPDMKRLQLILQGSVSVQVNAGAVAYVHSFLDASVVSLHPVKHIERLKGIFRQFITCCGRALEINGQLIKSDQKMYQEDLKEKYACLKSELVGYVGDPDDEGAVRPVSCSSSLSSLTR